MAANHGGPAAGVTVRAARRAADLGGRRGTRAGWGQPPLPRVFQRDGGQTITNARPMTLSTGMVPW